MPNLYGTGHQAYISSVRDSNRKLYDAVHELLNAQTQWNSLDYGNTLPNGTGVNDGLLASDVGAVVFATANAIKTLFDQGHGTNVSKLL